MRRLLRLSLLLAFAAPSAMSCADEPAPEPPCADIPRGGCPLGRGASCDDPTCLAVYACRAGNVWELDHACPLRDAADARADAGDASADAPLEATPTLDAGPDAPAGASGGPGCGALQAPDCSLGFALACPAGCCGCEDLFVCEGGGWTYWSTCR
jgi:hypothetical protein